MPVYEIKCFKKRCMKLKIVDFENTPITRLKHPETEKEVGDLKIKAYDADGTLLGEYVYAKDKPELELCFIRRGWVYLEFDPMPCERPTGYPDEEEWDQLTLAADIIAYKAVQAAVDNGVRPSKQELPRDVRAEWTYRRVSHGMLNLPQRLQWVNGKLDEVRPKQRCSMRFMLDERDQRCPSCKGLQTKYLLELAPLFCWIPALAKSRLGAIDDWDSITANNLAAMSSLAYAAPDTRTLADNGENEERKSYDATILHTLDNLRTQRSRPYRVGGDWMDMILHEMPYEWHYHDMQFHAVEDEEKNPTDSQAFMMTNRDTIIIAVRGTASGKDFILDGKFFNTASPEVLNNVGSVHQGFLQSFEYLWKTVYEYCKNHGLNDREPKRIFLTGHSLGGAVATLLACALHKEFGDNPITLYTYASPRVGDMDFARHWNVVLPHMRHVLNTDLVPAIPPRAFEFLHFGHLRQMSMVKAKGETMPWIGDYGLDQMASAIKTQPNYRCDNAPWGPEEIIGGNGLNDTGLATAVAEEIKRIFNSTLLDLAGVRHHFMSNYLSFLQLELRQRYQYAGTGRPLLSYHIHPGLLKVRNEIDRGIEAYMRPVSTEGLFGRHISELHPLPTVDEEVRRFCRDIGQLPVMRDAWIDEVHKKLLKSQLDLLRQMEAEEGLPWRSTTSAFEGEREALQTAMEESRAFLRENVQARSKDMTIAMLM
jgi:hypothetical protein